MNELTVKNKSQISHVEERATFMRATSTKIAQEINSLGNLISSNAFHLFFSCVVWHCFPSPFLHSSVSPARGLIGRAARDA